MAESMPSFAPTMSPVEADSIGSWPPPYLGQLKVMATVLLVYLWGIALPFASMMSYLTFVTYGDHPTIKLRNKPLMMATHIVVSLFLFVYIPLDCIENAWHVRALRLPDIWGYNGNTTLVYAIIILFFARFWLCYMMNRKAAESQLWRRQLDPNMRSWVLEYYHTVANPRLIFAVAFVVWIILSMASFSTPFITQDLYWICLISLFSCGALLAIYIVMLYHLYHFPNDAWGMRNEFTSAVVLLAVSLTPSSFYSFYYAFHEDQDVRDREEDRLLVVWCVTTGAAVSGYFFVTGLAPLITIYLQNARMNKRGTSQGPDALLRILSSNRLYEAFCVHLTTEFCVENLLFTVEILQLREYLLATKKITKEDLNKESILYRARVSKHVPYSPIILPYLVFQKKNSGFTSLLKARSLSSYNEEHSSSNKESGLNAVSAEVNRNGDNRVTDRFAFFATAQSFSSKITLQKHGSPSLSPISEDGDDRVPQPITKTNRSGSRFRSPTNRSNSTSPRERTGFEENPLTPRQVTLSYSVDVIEKQTSMEPAPGLEDLGITNTVLGYRKSLEVRRLLSLNQMQAIFSNDMNEAASVPSHSEVMSGDIATKALELELEDEDTLSPLQESELAAAGRKAGHRRLSSKLNADAFGTAAELESYKRSAAEFDPERDIEQIFEAIWRKYIGTNAHLMVNISGHLYRKLERRRTTVQADGFMDDVVGMWTELEEAAKQVFGLLRDSYTRFSYVDVIEEMTS